MRGTGSKDTGSKDTGSKDTGSKDTGSEGAGSKDTGSEGAGEGVSQATEADTDAIGEVEPAGHFRI